MDEENEEENEEIEWIVIFVRRKNWEGGRRIRVGGVDGGRFKVLFYSFFNLSESFIYGAVLVDEGVGSEKEDLEDREFKVWVIVGFYIEIG